MEWKNQPRIAHGVRLRGYSWSKSHVFDFNHPYFAITDKNGKYEMPRVPAGVQLEVCVWHEGAGLQPPLEKLMCEMDKATTLDIKLKVQKEKKRR